MQSSFTIKFDGLPHGEHSIDVTEYANSLLSMSKMLETAQKLIVPDYEIKKFDITAQEEGSVETLLEIAFIGVGLFASGMPAEKAKVLSLIPTTWEALKKLKDLAPSPQAGQPIVNVTIDNFSVGGDLINNMPSDQATLVQNPTFQRYAVGTMRPLIQDAATNMTVLDNAKNVIETFDKTDAEDILIATDTEKKIQDDRILRTDVVVFGTSHDEQRLRIGLDSESTRWAKVTDPIYAEWMSQTGSAEPNGSTLDVDLRTVTYLHPSGQRTNEWYITHVYTDKSPDLFD